MGNSDKGKGGGLYQTVLIISIILGIITGIWKLIQDSQKPIIHVENRLALPVIVVVNESATYTRLVNPGSSITITLLSKEDFPTKIHWSVVQNKNSNGNPIGVALNGDLPHIDKGKKLIITNVVGSNIYFYPIINNTTGERCTVVVNDGLSIQYTVGMSNTDHRMSISGYFPYAQNSNVTVKCPNQTYWRGERNGNNSAPLTFSNGSGVADIFFP